MHHELLFLPFLVARILSRHPQPHSTLSPVLRFESIPMKRPGSLAVLSTLVAAATGRTPASLQQHALQYDRRSSRTRTISGGDLLQPAAALYRCTSLLCMRAPSNKLPTAMWPPRDSSGS